MVNFEVFLFTTSDTRRMAESAAVLVYEVIPRVPVRQWVLSLPIPLRILFAAPRHGNTASPGT